MRTDLSVDLQEMDDYRKAYDPEANMWLNPQSWAVISGLAKGAGR